MKREKEFDFFDRPDNIRRLWIALYTVCGLLIVFDLLIARPPHFGFDGIFGFYALIGFVSCAALILFSKIVGLILKVREDYYDE